MTEPELLQRQEAAGAFVSEAGSKHPQVLNFGDPHAEYIAAREKAALFDLSDRTQIEMTGTDRAKFLHNFCTNEIQKRQPGEGCEAFVTNVKGRILGHIFVFIDEESLWIESVPGAEQSLLDHLDRYIITEDVTLHARSSELGELLVSGPDASKILGSLGFVVEELQDYSHRTDRWKDTAVSIRRVDLLGAMGFLLSAPKKLLPDLWSRCREAGCQPAGSQVFEALRIEAGMPLYHVDLSDDHLAQEAARTREAISFTKGCYLGQEPIARIDALGHVNRELRGLKLSSGPVPQAGSPVFGGDDDKQIGTITSATLSYADDLPVAMAILRSGFANRGTNVFVEIESERVAATVFWRE